MLITKFNLKEDYAVLRVPRKGSLTYFTAALGFVLIILEFLIHPLK